VSSSGISGFHNRAAARGPGVVTGRYGTIGRAFYLESDYWPLNTTLYVIAFNGNNPKFVRYVLELVPLASDSEKSAVPGINRNYVHTLGVAIPPKSEQVEIVAAIEQLESKHRSKVAMIGSATERLREYRTALVSAAVTGQIDVGSYRKEPEAVMEAS
jgi:type I restriction enzyme S subunit